PINRHPRARQPTFVIRLRVSRPPSPSPHRPYTTLFRPPTNGTHAHRGCPAVTRDRSMRVAGHQRIGLRQRHHRAGQATIVIRHHISGGHFCFRVTLDAIVTPRPSNGTHAHRGCPAVTRD